MHTEHYHHHRQIEWTETDTIRGYSHQVGDNLAACGGIQVLEKGVDERGGEWLRWTDCCMGHRGPGIPWQPA